MSFNRHDRILSLPVPVYWAGWKTTTTELQGNGWQLAVEFEPSRYTYRLMMHHRLVSLTALSDSLYLDRMVNSVERYHLDSSHMSLPTFVVRHVSSKFQVTQIFDNLSRFVQIDAEPMLERSPVKSMEDYNIFRTMTDKAEQVLVDKADMTVIEHLEAIKRLQSDKQRELRDNAMRSQEHTKPKQLIATLVSYDVAA